MSKKKEKKAPVVLEQIAILDFAAEAKCIAKVNDEVIFVQGAVAPGDIADLRILKSKKSFKQAQAINIQPLSEHRTDVACSHFGEICRLPDPMTTASAATVPLVHVPDPTRM